MGGHPSGATVGTELVYNISGKSVSAFNVGMSYAQGPMFGALTTSSNFSTFNLGLLYKVNPELSLATQSTHSSAKSIDLLGIGCLYKAPFGTVKAKYSGSGVLSACLIKELAPKVTVKASAAVPTSDMSKITTG